MLFRWENIKQDITKKAFNSFHPLGKLHLYYKCHFLCTAQSSSWLVNMTLNYSSVSKVIFYITAYHMCINRYTKYNTSFSKIFNFIGTAAKRQQNADWKIKGIRLTYHALWDFKNEKHATLLTWKWLYKYKIIPPQKRALWLIRKSRFLWAPVGEG